MSEGEEKFEPSTGPQLHESQCDNSKASAILGDNSEIFTFRSNDGAMDDSFLSEMSSRLKDSLEKIEKLEDKNLKLKLKVQKYKKEA